MDHLLITTDSVLPVLLQAELADQKSTVRHVESWRRGQSELIVSQTQPDLVILDLEHQCEPETALESFARDFAHVRLLILTGAAALSAEDLHALGFAHVLSRPCSVEELLQAIHQATKDQPRKTHEHSRFRADVAPPRPAAS